jgi:hypothetical protein
MFLAQCDRPSVEPITLSTEIIPKISNSLTTNLLDTPYWKIEQIEIEFARENDEQI